MGGMVKSALRRPRFNIGNIGNVFPLVAGGVFKGLWVFTVLLWPFLKWIISIEAFVRLLLMIYHWDDPASHAGWTFALHFFGLVALTYFVGCYRPKGI